jgi:hypothetical protein
MKINCNKKTSACYIFVDIFTAACKIPFKIREERGADIADCRFGIEEFRNCDRQVKA